MWADYERHVVVTACGLPVRSAAELREHIGECADGCAYLKAVQS